MGAGSLHTSGPWVTHPETRTKLKAETSHVEPCPVTEASGLPREVGSVSLAPSQPESDTDGGQLAFWRLRGGQTGNERVSSQEAVSSGVCQRGPGPTPCPWRSPWHPSLSGGLHPWPYSRQADTRLGAQDDWVCGAWRDAGGDLEAAAGRGAQVGTLRHGGRGKTEGGGGRPHSDPGA